MLGPSSVFNESVVYGRRNEKFISQNHSEKSSIILAQSWPKRAKKGYFKSERRKVKLAARHHKKHGNIAISRSHFVLQNVQVETSEHLDLLNL